MLSCPDWSAYASSNNISTKSYRAINFVAKPTLSCRITVSFTHIKSFIFVKAGKRLAAKTKNMRKLIFGINTTLDGCCDHTKGNANEEVHEYFTQLLREADVLLYGRKTYELMVPFWPDVAKNPSGSTSIDDFAEAFDAVNKIVVVSRTLESAEGNTAIIRSNLQEEVLKLKQEEGKAIVAGGVDVPTQLMQLGLIDEYHVVVHPVIAGEGRRLFDGIILPEQSQLRLVGSKVFQSGHVALRYVKGLIQSDFIQS